MNQRRESDNPDLPARADGRGSSTEKHQAKRETVDPPALETEVEELFHDAPFEFDQNDSESID